MKTSTPETKKQAVKNLFDYMDIIEDIGIVAWLDGGTLLGAYRDKDFCDGDEDDIDIFTWANYQCYIPEIIARAEKQGFKLYHHWTGDKRALGKAQQISFKRNNLKIDFNFFEKRGNIAWGLVYHGSTGIPQITKTKYYELLGQIDFYGRKFNCPRDIEGHLKERYGDWKTPIHRTQYSCYNPEQLKSITIGFDFWQV